ncbi:MAG: hypothetical protein WBV94_05065 [Blastocatellia bacterium]
MAVDNVCTPASAGDIATAGITEVASVALAGTAMLEEQGWKGAASGVVAGYSASLLLRSVLGGYIGIGTTLLLMGIGAALGVREKEE